MEPTPTPQIPSRYTLTTDAEAVQWTGDEAQVPIIQEWLGPTRMVNHFAADRQLLIVPVLPVQVGQWIVKAGPYVGVQDDDDFRAKYTRLEG